MPDWKQCVMSLVDVWCTVFPHGLPARWFLQATCEPGPLQAAKTRVSSTFFSTTDFCLPRMDPKEREKHCRLICWCISKNLCRFYSIIYASVVCIKDGSNYTPSRCVCLHRKKKVKENAAMRAGRQQFHDTTSKLYGKKFRTASSLPTWGHIVSSHANFLQSIPKHFLLPALDSICRERANANSKDSLHHIFLSSLQNVWFSKTFIHHFFLIMRFHIKWKL